MFYVGQKVKCINGKFHHSVVEWADHVPIEGEVYTVRRVTAGTYPLDGVRAPALQLAELVNPKDSRGGEVCFSTWRFVPLELEEAVSEGLNEHVDEMVGV